MPTADKPNPFEGDTSPPEPPKLPADAPRGAVAKMPGDPGIYVDEYGAEVKPVEAKPVPAPAPRPAPAPEPKATGG